MYIVNFTQPINIFHVNLLTYEKKLSEPAWTLKITVHIYTQIYTYNNHGYQCFLAFFSPEHMGL